MGGHMRHHSYSLPKKMKFSKFADGRTYVHTDGHTYGRTKKVTLKDPLHINARDLKMGSFLRPERENMRSSIANAGAIIIKENDIEKMLYM